MTSSRAFGGSVTRDLDVDGQPALSADAVVSPRSSVARTENEYVPGAEVERRGVGPVVAVVLHVDRRDAVPARRDSDRPGAVGRECLPGGGVAELDLDVAEVLVVGRRTRRTSAGCRERP